jgi:L-ascorbate metabolism protein UlaG (beta-lactamase superfamily)
MRDVDCDVALLPIGGTYTMDAAEAAAAACDLLHVGEVIPMHYGDIVGTQVDVDRFVTRCSIPVRVLPLERG